jgi:predicted esterase
MTDSVSKAGVQIRSAGEPLEHAKAAMLMMHGRGATAEDILSLAAQFDRPGFFYIAPQALGNTWYPNRFLDPLSTNEPWLTSTLYLMRDILDKLIQGGMPPERIIILGFSQGGCLALEFTARNARRYGGLVGLSSALIGPDDTQRDYKGSLDGTPVFLGCSDTDFHIPKERVTQAADALRHLGGAVTERLYPNLDHSVNQDEIGFVRGMMQSLLTTS